MESLRPDISADTNPGPCINVSMVCVGGPNTCSLSHSVDMVELLVVSDPARRMGKEFSEDCFTLNNLI